MHRATRLEKLEKAHKLVLSRDFSLPLPPSSLFINLKLTNMAPESMQAIKIVSAGNAEIQTAPLPELRDHFILVKVNAVAINPTDWY